MARPSTTQDTPLARLITMARHLAGVCVMLAAGSASAQPVFDDFSSGNDSAWTRFDSNQMLFGVPSTFDTSSGGYRIASPRVPSTYGFPIVSSVRTDAVNADAAITVEIVGWSGPGQFGLIARGQADLSFYAVYFTPVSLLAPNSSNFRITRYNWNSAIGGLVGTNIAGYVPFPRVNQGDRYRISFSQTGPLLQATLFNITTSTMVQTLSVVDTNTGALTLAGSAGITLSSNDGAGTASLAPYSVTFDNFRVVPGPACDWLANGCYGDYDRSGGVDGDDVIAFFSDWDTGHDCADLDASAGIDGDDVIMFFTSWDNSGSGTPGC